jgi:4-amino-4-deoxy-L-arabinose transferase-like glycosyltransferase
MTPSPRALWAIFGAAAAIRLANVLTLAGDPANFLIDDAQLYWPGAEHLLRFWAFDPPAVGMGPEHAGAPGSERVPLYLFFVAAIRLVAGPHPVAVPIVQAFLDAGTCVLIARLGAMVDMRTGIAAGALAAIWPNLIVHSAAILSETLFVFLFAAMLLAAARYLAEQRPGHAARAGFLAGLAIMTRTIALYIPLAMAVAAPFVARARGHTWRAGLAAGGLVLICAALPVAPWIARNVATHGAVALTTQEGSHLYNWVLPLVRQAHDGTPHEAAAREIEGRLFKRLEDQGIDRLKLDPFARSRIFRDMALEELRAMPPGVIAEAWIKGAAINLVAPAITIDPRVRRERTASTYNDPSPGLWGRMESYLATTAPALGPWIVAALAASTLSGALQLAGLVALARRRPWAAVFAVLALTYILLATGPIYSPKYRMPMEPILILLTAMGLLSLWRARGN